VDPILAKVIAKGENACLTAKCASEPLGAFVAAVGAATVRSLRSPLGEFDRIGLRDRSDGQIRFLFGWQRVARIRVSGPKAFTLRGSWNEASQTLSTMRRVAASLTKSKYCSLVTSCFIKAKGTHWSSSSTSPQTRTKPFSVVRLCHSFKLMSAWT
jgi:hypothetical protein